MNFKSFKTFINYEKYDIRLSVYNLFSCCCVKTIQNMSCKERCACDLI